MKINLFKEHYRSPRILSVPTLMKEMQSERQEKKITAFRKELSYYRPDDSYPESKKPPCIFWSSRYEKKEGRLRWLEYTGIVMVEVNDLSGLREAELLRQKAETSLSTFAAFTGSGGRSLKILALFSRPDGTLPSTEAEAELFHAHAYLRMAGFYRFQLGHPVTLSTPSLNDQCRLSYDPGLYYNPEALPVTFEQPLNMPTDKDMQQCREQITAETSRLPGFLSAGKDRWVFLFDIALQETLNHFDQSGGTNDPETFLIRLAENSFRSGVPEEEAIKRTRVYIHKDINESRVRIVIRNVYRLGKGFGEQPVMPVMQLLAFQLEEFIQRRYELRRNTLKKTVEYKERAALFARFCSVTDEVLNTISLQAHQEGLNFWDRDVKRYVYSNKIPPFNPIDDYLSNLPEWDGEDHILKLALTLPTDNQHWPVCFYRWFLGMVAQWKGLNRMHGNCVTPLLTGEQSLGKSTWCKQILPPELREYYTESIDLGTRRNAELALNRFALINLDEFDSISENRQPLLKHLLQLPEVALRRPHRSDTEILPRYASFIATSNPDDVLTDPTGSRRFLCVAVKEGINHEMTLNYPQLYAQALTALRKGERYWLDRDEEQEMTGHNQSFTRMLPEEQWLLTHFRPLLRNDPKGEWLPAIQILEFIGKQHKIVPGRITMTSFGRILRKHKFVRKHTENGNQYKVMRIEPEQGD